MWPVRVVRRRVKGHWGLCVFHQDRRPRFVISVDPSLTGDRLREYLAHEWAHATSWSTEAVEEHGPEWGIAYARCYTALIGRPG